MEVSDVKSVQASVSSNFLLRHNILKHLNGMFNLNIDLSKYGNNAKIAGVILLS